MVFGIYLFGLTHGQGHQIAQKGKGLPGAGRKKGKNTKQNKKVGREYNHRTHKSLTFRLFGHSQRSTAIYPVSAGTFIAIREGDPPQLPHVHKVPQAKSFIFFPHTQTTLNSETHPTKPLQTKEQQNNIRRIHVAIVQSNSKKINNHPFPPPSVVHYQSYTERARPHLGHLLLLAKTLYSHLWQYQSSYLTPARSP